MSRAVISSFYKNPISDTILSTVQCKADSHRNAQYSNTIREGESDVSRGRNGNRYNETIATKITINTVNSSWVEAESTEDERADDGNAGEIFMFFLLIYT